MYTINPDINHDYSAQERTKIKNQSFTFNRTEKFCKQWENLSIRQEKQVMKLNSFGDNSHTKHYN